jgi:hypothetical protein
MNTITHRNALIPGLITFLSTSLFAEIAPAPYLTGITISNNQAVVTWINGRPSFQLQTRTLLADTWRNVGSPTTTTSAAIPITGTQAFFRVVSDFTARYQVVFNATWSQATHPADWPTGAHFSGLVGGTHNSAVHFFREGQTASEGIRLMAERGQQATLLSEVAPAIANGTAQQQLAGGGIRSSPGTVSLTFPEPMRRDYPMVTLVSMIAPSPDWFVGVDSLSLIEEDNWVTNKVVTLYGLDAGTDSGVTYTSPDLVTMPRDVVTRFTGFPALVNGTIVPFGTFAFTRLD